MIAGKSIWEVHGSDTHKQDNMKSIENRAPSEQRTSVDSKSITEHHQKQSIDHRSLDCKEPKVNIFDFY